MNETQTSVAGEIPESVAAIIPSEAPKGITEEMIRAKMKAGMGALNRETAIKVLERQAKHDTQTAKEAKEAKSKKGS